MKNQPTGQDQAVPTCPTQTMDQIDAARAVCRVVNQGDPTWRGAIKEPRSTNIPNVCAEIARVAHLFALGAVKPLTGDDIEAARFEADSKVIGATRSYLERVAEALNKRLVPASAAPGAVETPLALTLKDIEAGMRSASDGLQVHHGDLLDFVNARLSALKASARSAPRVAELEAAIRQHRDERGNDRCWLDDQRLYAVLGEAQPDTSLPPESEFIENCRRFHATRQAPPDTEALLKAFRTDNKQAIADPTIYSSAPPSAERILTQATDVEACRQEIVDRAFAYGGGQADLYEWIGSDALRAILRKHFPARTGAAVVPDAEDLYLEAYRMRRAALGHTSFRSDRESWRSGTDNKDLARDKKVIVESVNACLAEFRRLNPAPSTASASESEEK